MLTCFRTHALTLCILGLTANLGLQLYLAVGQLKPWSELNGIDVAGEGGTAALALAWLVMLLRSRPSGRVTRLLAWGLGLMCFSWWMDFLDEFIQMPVDAIWDNWLETAPMPVGVLLLTLGLYHLHLEQKAISLQMQKRERVFREHRLFDHLTPLNNAQYLRQQLQALLGERQGPLCLVGLDLDDFSALNQRYGMPEGDAVLQGLTQLLLLNLRDQDLLCRLAGDRFVVLLPATTEQQARQMANALQQAVQSWAYYSPRFQERIPLHASVAMVMAFNDDPDRLLQRLNIALATSKSRLNACA